METISIIQDSLKQGLAPALVVAVYLIIIKIIDSRRENVQIKISSEFTKSITAMSSFLSEILDNIVSKDKDKCKIAIEDTFNATAMRLINFVSTTIVNNHVANNRENIIANINNIVNSEYYTIYSTLSMYKINENIASEVLNKDWMAVWTKDMTDIIFNSTMSKEDKIISFSNKLSIKFKSHIMYVSNHVLK